MKKYAVLMGIIFSLGVMVGCSEEKEAFNDENIIFIVESDTIELTNQSGFDLDNLSLKISYPLNDEKLKNSNAEREVLKFIEETKIKSNDTKEISIPHNLKEGIEVVDLEIDFKGNVIEGNEKVPFNIGGSLSALVSNP
ncbi:hypothetical protein J416_08417 [Gracilibacillus halophilus YIM-C55.5]|uniref:Lipoprotein n=1 Tax=Gracilibacillus halophilus YIM-C55.5 TaxID=1308866 RepID=N4WR61_9BACI|nr:hypothetical protein [Gracilibacillus halophilus]ENH96920.1 hypothetical protein J416_08417 [Gracilibacillus halophilus YIM-C55.5]